MGKSLVILPKLMLASRVTFVSPGRVTSTLPVSLWSLYLGVASLVSGVVSRSPLKVILPVPVNRCDVSKRVECSTVIFPMSSLSRKMPLIPLTIMLPMELLTLSVKVVA